MRNFVEDLKREIKPLLITYVIFDIIFIGALAYAISNANEGDNVITAVINNLLPAITSLKFFEGIFIDFGFFLKGSLWTLLIIFAIYIILKLKKEEQNDYDGIESGSSDWSKNGEEFRKVSDGREILNRKNGFILSKEHYLGTDLKKVLINKNVLVIGGSGTGKSACYIKPNILQTLGSYVITDPKGELYRETSGFLKSKGYEVKAFNLVNPEYSDRYNPLSHIIDNTSVDVLAETLVAGAKKGAPTGGDTFWDDTAKMLIKACIYYVISVLPPEERNISSCLNIIRAGGADGEVFKKIFLEELKPEHPGRKEYENFSTSADKTMQSIIISTISKISTFDTPAMQRITTSNNIKFDDLGKKKLAIYVITSTSDSTYDFISTMFFSQMLQKLFLQADRNGGTLNNQVYFLLDEFANIGQIPDFERKLSVTRSMGISISIVIQALDQLESLYKENFETIVGNCDTQLFLGSQSIKTCEYFSKSLGQKTIKIQSKSISKDKDGKTKQGISVSEQRQGRELMTVDELKRLDPNEEIIVVRGLRPIRAKKAWYYRYHPERDNAKRFEIHDIKEMPKTEILPIKIMDVQKHFENVKRRQMEKMSARGTDISFDTDTISTPKPKVPTSNPVNIDIDENIGGPIINSIPNINTKDSSTNSSTSSNNSANKLSDINLQIELEKKFDELFGTGNSH